MIITGAIICASYWPLGYQGGPYGAWTQHNFPENPICGSPLDYNQWVDIYWSTYGPVYDYDDWKRDKLAHQ